jgi:hypothetical protein
MASVGRSSSALIGLSQATALRDHTRRWMWWFAANLTTYLLAAAAYEFGKRVLDVFSLSTQITAAFPLLGFLIYRVWMLWVTAPEATAAAPPGHGTADTAPPTPGIPD